MEPSGTEWPVSHITIRDRTEMWPQNGQSGRRGHISLICGRIKITAKELVTFGDELGANLRGAVC